MVAFFQTLRRPFVSCHSTFPRGLNCSCSVHPIVYAHQMGQWPSTERFPFALKAKSMEDPTTWCSMTLPMASWQTICPTWICVIASRPQLCSNPAHHDWIMKMKSNCVDRASRNARRGSAYFFHQICWKCCWSSVSLCRDWLKWGSHVGNTKPLPLFCPLRLTTTRSTWPLQWLCSNR